MDSRCARHLWTSRRVHVCCAVSILWLGACTGPGFVVVERMPAPSEASNLPLAVARPQFPALARSEFEGQGMPAPGDEPFWRQARLQSRLKRTFVAVLLEELRGRGVRSAFAAAGEDTSFGWRLEADVRAVHLDWGLWQGGTDRISISVALRDTAQSESIPVCKVEASSEGWGLEGWSAHGRLHLAMTNAARGVATCLAENQ